MPAMKIMMRQLVLLGVVAALVAGRAAAQSFPLLKPLPPKKTLIHAAALTANTANTSTSPWQQLTNQPPVLDPVDCGPGNPLLLTDGTVLLQDAEIGRA